MLTQISEDLIALKDRLLPKPQRETVRLVAGHELLDLFEQI